MVSLIVLFYLIGCVFSLLRLAASEKAIDEKYIDHLEPRFSSIYELLDDSMNIIVVGMSWIGFFAGFLVFLTSGEKNEKVIVWNYKIKKNGKDN